MGITARRFTWPGTLVHRSVGKQQAAFVRVFAAVFKFNADFDRFVEHALAAGKLLAQFQHIVGRLLDIEIHRVVLLDQRHLGTVGGNQRAFADFRFADDAGNRRGDIGMVHIDLRRIDGRLRRFHLRFGRTLGSKRRIPFLAADWHRPATSGW